MGSIKTFEDLQVWRHARALALDVYLVSKSETFVKDFSLKDHINKTAGSVMDNIAEGFDRGGNKELIQFLAIAKGSCAELRSQLHRALDRGHVTKDEFSFLNLKAEEVSKQLAGFMNYLKSSEMKGSKFAKEPIVKYGESDIIDNVEY